MLNGIFETLGFKEEEAKTYLALLDSGASTASDLSARLGVPRPTIYGYLEKLVAAGLVTEDSQRNAKLFAAQSADRLRLLYRKKIHHLRSREKMLDTIIPELDARSGTGFLRPRMNFFEGRRGLETALDDMLASPPGTMTTSFWPARLTMDILGTDYWQRHNARRIQRDIHLSGIWPRTQGINISTHPFMGWGAEQKSELKYAPLGIDFAMGYWIYGNKTIFLSTRTETYGYTLESADMAQMMRAQHAILWKTSEPVPYDKALVHGFIRELQSA